MACAAPLDPTGYIGCAASPISVTRPVPHAVSGSRSHIGYSKNSGVASINASTLRSGSLKFFAYGYARPIVPRRDQLSRSGVIAAAEFGAGGMLWWSDRLETYCCWD